MADRTKFRREPKLGTHDPDVIRQIVDAAPFCHLGLTDHDGHPLVVPTIHARIGDVLYVHGSAASRTLRRLAGGIPVSCTITLLDGLVMARSAFWSTMNYRSVMVFGEGRLVLDADEAVRALDAIVDKVAPGRSSEVRRPTAKELAATKVVALPLDEASAKVRAGDPNDDPADLDSDAWAGTVPIRMVLDPAVPAANLADGIDVPPSVAGLGPELGAAPD